MASRRQKGGDRGNAFGIQLVFRSELFESYRYATPLLGSYVGDGLGKCPAMTSEILDVVLALAVGMVSWGREDAGTLLAGSLVVIVHIGHAHHDEARAVDWRVTFGHHNASVTHFKLDAMVGNA